MDDKWVSVKDLMPEKYRPVIVHVRHTEKYREGTSAEDSWHIVEEDTWLGDRWEINADSDIHEVTHWMPLPEPPKG